MSFIEILDIYLEFWWLLVVDFENYTKWKMDFISLVSSWNILENS